MTAHAQPGRRSPVAAALARAEAWLLDPPSEPAFAERVEPLERLRPVVAVVGLAPRCGATTVARAVAAALALHDESGAAAVASRTGRGGPSLGTPAAARLARALARSAPGTPRVTGRICLVQSEDHGALAAVARRLAPLVLDVSHGANPAGAVAIADSVVLVAAPEIEPALAAVVAASIARVGPEPVTVVNRVREPGAWAGRPAILLPESMLAGRLAAAGREPPGALGEAISELARRCGGAVR